jgi:hypothetical protein
MSTPNRHSGTLPLAIALTMSVAVHLFVLTPLLMTAMGPRHANRIDAELDPAPPPEAETLIGIEESEASTLDWIGYEEYQEHLAEASETNQAAFTETPSQPSIPMDAMEEVANETLDPAQPSEPAEPATQAASEPVPAAVNSSPAPFDLSFLIEAARLWAEAALMPPVAGQTAPDSPNQATSEPAHEAQNPANSSQPAVPASDDSLGDPSDKESDPSSVIEVAPEQWVLGKPLAARGLELFPQKPSFTLLTRMTAAVRDPVAELEFDRRGVVIRARLLKSSGHAQVDRNIIDSLYGWRAKGERLQSLGTDETFPVSMLFLLAD